MRGGAAHGPPFLRGHRRLTGGITVGGGIKVGSPTLNGATFGQVRRVHLQQSGVGQDNLDKGVNVAAASTRRRHNTFKSSLR